MSLPDSGRTVPDNVHLTPTFVGGVGDNHRDFQTLFTPILSSQQNNRDHRKIIAVDGTIAFTGGINLADEYINELERFGHWKDSGIMLHGEAAWSLTMIFLEMWNFELMQVNPRLPKDNYAAFYPWNNESRGIESDGYVQHGKDDRYTYRHHFVCRNVISKV
jgi:phosphatidylserine/phosphatidylglycerophosphate/cardiolipin synthase-like enzyme